MELVNVSYDPTRELYKEINQAFAAYYQKQPGGKKVKITQSHGGSGSQARAVIDGLKADVVTLALAGDIEALRKRGLIKEGWQDHPGLPNNSCPYTSTIVFVVRRGNPKGIKDWPDLARSDVDVITPNPKTSGGARWNFLAAWGYQTKHLGKTEAEAQEFLRQLYGRVVKLDTGARGSTDTFLRHEQGHVLIAWENEAVLLLKEAAQEGLELVYPSASILAEPPVAIVDAVVDERGTRDVALAYLKFLYENEGQAIIAKHGYRPFKKEFQKQFLEALPENVRERAGKLEPFTLKEVAGDWEQAQKKFFDDGGVYDQIKRRGGP